MNSITNDSYLLVVFSNQGNVFGPLEYSLVLAIRHWRQFPSRIKTWTSERPILAPAAIVVCILALWGSTHRLDGRLNGIDALHWLHPAISVRNPNPAPPSQNEMPAVSLNNGTEIKSRLRLEGHGELTLKNETSFDSIAILVDPRTRSVVRSFYVQASKSFVEKNIAPGIYQLYFSTGKDWDSRTRSFQDDVIYGRFERQINFYERQDSLTGNTEFRGYTITLQYVEGGDEACLPIDKQTFQQMMMDQPSDSAKLE